MKDHTGLTRLEKASFQLILNIKHKSHERIMPVIIKFFCEYRINFFISLREKTSCFLTYKLYVFRNPLFRLSQKSINI